MLIIGREFNINGIKYKMPITKISFFFLWIELVDDFLLRKRCDCRFNQAVGPVQVHAEQYEGHW